MFQRTLRSQRLARDSRSTGFREHVFAEQIFVEHPFVQIEMMITPAYAAFAALMLLALSIRTIRLRRKAGIAVGSEDDVALARAIRAHGNFIEYTPFTLLLIWFAEQQGAAQGVVHGLCLCLIVGRVIHALAVSSVDEDVRLRVAGMVLTFTALAGAALGIAGVYLGTL